MKPGPRLVRRHVWMLAWLSSLGAPGATAIAGSIGVHGALLLVGLRIAAASPSSPQGERLLAVDLEQPVELAPPPPEIPRPETKEVATEPQVRATPLRGPPVANPAPARPDVALPPAAPPPAAVAEPAAVQEAAPALTADEGMPSFTIPMGGGSAPAHGAVAAAGTAAAPMAPAPSPSPGVSAPAICTRGGQPAYPPGARAERLEGDVLLEVVVSTAGAVESVRVLKSAGHGFDESAVAEVRGYRYSPAMKDGRPVRETKTVAIHFRLN